MDAAEWTGRVGSAWALEWQRTDRSFSGLATHLNAAILTAAADAKRAVDIGCGAGATSIALATARPDIAVTGIDISPDLIAAARARTADIANLRFVAGPVETTIASVAPADLFFSRHGVMFFADPVAAFATLRSAASPGAKLVFSCFRSVAENPWAGAMIEAIAGPQPPPPPGYIPGPFAFAGQGFVTVLLREAGWGDVAATPIDFLYRAGGGDDPVEDAIGFFRRIGPVARMLASAEEQDRPALIEKLRAALAASRHGNSVDFPAAAWLWSARAI